MKNLSPTLLRAGSALPCPATHLRPRNAIKVPKPNVCPRPPSPPQGHLTPRCQVCPCPSAAAGTPPQANAPEGAESGWRRLPSPAATCPRSAGTPPSPQPGTPPDRAAARAPAPARPPRARASSHLPERGGGRGTVPSGRAASAHSGVGARGTVPSGRAGPGRAGPSPAAHLQTVIKLRLSTAALRDGTLFLRAETLSPPKPRDAISAGGRWSRRGWRGAFVPGLPLSGMLRPPPPPHAEEEAAPVFSPLLLLPPPAPRGRSAPRQATGRPRRRRGPHGGGGSGPPPARCRQPGSHSASESQRRRAPAPPANQRAGGARRGAAADGRRFKGARAANGSGREASEVLALEAMEGRAGERERLVGSFSRLGKG